MPDAYSASCLWLVDNLCFLENLAIDDYLALMAFLSGPGLVVRQQLMDRLVLFLRNNMRLQVPQS